jgi:hypothetical protein
MSFDWQTGVVLVAVAAAGAYLAHLAWQSVARRKSGCGGCGTCPANQTADEPEMVPLAQLAETAEPPRLQG